MIGGCAIGDDDAAAQVWEQLQKYLVVDHRNRTRAHKEKQKADQKEWLKQQKAIEKGIKDKKQLKQYQVLGASIGGVRARFSFIHVLAKMEAKKKREAEIAAQDRAHAEELARDKAKQEQVCLSRSFCLSVCILFLCIEALAGAARGAGRAVAHAEGGARLRNLVLSEA